MRTVQFGNFVFITDIKSGMLNKIHNFSNFIPLIRKHITNLIFCGISLIFKLYHFCKKFPFSEIWYLFQLHLYQFQKGEQSRQGETGASHEIRRHSLHLSQSRAILAMTTPGGVQRPGWSADYFSPLLTEKEGPQDARGFLRPFFQ